MSISVSVEVYTTPEDVAYHGNEGTVRTRNIEIAPPAVAYAMAQQLRHVAERLEEQARANLAVQTGGESLYGPQANQPPPPFANRTARRAAKRRGR